MSSPKVNSTPEKPQIDSAQLMMSIAGIQKQINRNLSLAHQHRYIRQNNKQLHEVKAMILDIDVARLKVIKHELLLELSKNQLNNLING